MNEPLSPASSLQPPATNEGRPSGIGPRTSKTDALKPQGSGQKKKSLTHSASEPQVSAAAGSRPRLASNAGAASAGAATGSGRRKSTTAGTASMFFGKDGDASGSGGKFRVSPSFEELMSRPTPVFMTLQQALQAKGVVKSAMSDGHDTLVSRRGSSMSSNVPDAEQMRRVVSDRRRNNLGEIGKLSGDSLFLFAPTSEFRIWLTKVRCGAVWLTKASCSRLYQVHSLRRRPPSIHSAQGSHPLTLLLPV